MRRSAVVAAALAATVTSSCAGGRATDASGTSTVAPAVATTGASAAGGAVIVASPTAPTLTTMATPTTAPATTRVTVRSEPLRVVVVGDSVARSFVANLGDHGADDIVFVDGSIEGCGIFSDGVIRSSDGSYSRDTAQCDGWAARWQRAVAEARADVALVMVGAWDVFDLHRPSGVLAFASPAFDAEARANLQTAIDGLVDAGAAVALLEVACARPHDVPELNTPPLPERGEDWRAEHVNALLRAVADANAATTRFVEGPDAWCADPEIATDLRYRWDGVHPLAPGAALMFDAIAPALRSMPVARPSDPARAVRRRSAEPW